MRELRREETLWNLLCLDLTREAYITQKNMDRQKAQEGGFVFREEKPGDAWMAHLFEDRPLSEEEEEEDEAIDPEAPATILREFVM